MIITAQPATRNLLAIGKVDRVSSAVISLAPLNTISTAHSVIMASSIWAMLRKKNQGSLPVSFIHKRVRVIPKPASQPLRFFTSPETREISVIIHVVKTLYFQEVEVRNELVLTHTTVLL